MSGLSDLPNIGKVMEQQLRAVGVTTFDELKALGSRAAWLRIQSIDESACIHRLMGLEGAIRGVKKSELPPEVKAELREFYRAHRL